MDKAENWRDIPGYEGRYRISATGAVFATSRWIGRNFIGAGLMKPSLNGNGYLHVRLRRSDAWYSERRSIHRLLLETFFGRAPPGKPLALHRNDVGADNRLENLYWGDDKDNRADSIRNGTKRPWHRLHKRAKLKRRDAAEIRVLCKAGGSQAYVASLFDVSRSAVRRIVENKTYKT